MYDGLWPPALVMKSDTSSAKEKKRFFFKKITFQETAFSAAIKYIYYDIYTIYYDIYTVYTLYFFPVLFVQRLHTRRGIVGGRVEDIDGGGDGTRGVQLPSIRQHTSAYVSIRQHTSAYVSIRQHTSAYVNTREGSSCHTSARAEHP
jgi:hypothetical protein